MKKVTTLYVVACMLDEEDYGSVFFTTFNTKDEDEALKLASCICGAKRAKRSLCLINSLGEVIIL